MLLSPGDRVDRYEVLDLLGRGGMGEVYRARDPRLDRYIALKILRLDKGLPAENGERLLREARAVAALAHPNVLAVHDAGEAREPESIRGVPYIAMELVLGKSLKAYIGDDSVSMATRIAWLRDVARALGAAHEVGIVHRDVKPDNVMVRHDGVVKVLDFGIARRATVSIEPWLSTEGHSLPTVPPKGAPLLRTLTETGAIAGTPYYMAPEQLRAEVVDGRADQFAWGIVAHELLTGHPPWKRSHDALVAAAQILSVEPRTAREVEPSVPEAVSETISRALAKRRELRFESMRDVIDAMEGRRPFARVDAENSSQRPSVRRTLWMRASPFVLLALLTAGVVGVATVVSLGGIRVFLERRASRPAAEVSGSHMSLNPQAAAAYEAGMRLIRDGALTAAAARLDQATQQDPSFAAAHLGRAFLETIDWAFSDFGVIRDHLRAARAARDSLGPRDRMLLTALEPWVSMPPDFKRSTDLLRDATKEYPGDALLAFGLANSLNATDAWNEAIAEADRTLRLDPSFALAWDLEADFRGHETPRVIEAINKCLEISPAADTCLWRLARVQQSTGKCEELRDTMNRILATTPDSAKAYLYLAGALAATDQPIESVRFWLEKHWQRAGSERVRAYDEATLAVIYGDLAQAEERYRVVETLAQGDAIEGEHFPATYGRMLVELEAGKKAAAVATGEAYLARQPAWSAIWEASGTISIFSLEHAAGAISRARLVELRDQWLAAERKRREEANDSPSNDFVWARAYAQLVETKEDALAALAARGDAGSPFFQAVWEQADFDEWIGRTYFLAGRLDEAVEYLGRASRSCAYFVEEEALSIVRATAELGDALEAHGDRVGACAAYQRVLSRWGRTASAPPLVARVRARADIVCAR